MRHFDVAWSRKGSLDVLSARAFLGPVRAVDLDSELDKLREHFARFPESGAMVKVRGVYSPTLRKWPLTDTPFRLYYRVNLPMKTVVFVMLRHKSARPPRF